MDHNLLCSWLGLPAGCWPPNHFALLGLDPGASDADAIEASVHERMGILRRYQLTNPELATEAMNRLAQAMICLTDERSRVAYVAELRAQTYSANLEPPPFQARISDTAPAPLEEFAQAEPPTPPVAQPRIEPFPVVAVELAAVHTRRDLYFRIARTRQIQHLWERVGVHLNSSRQRLNRPTEAAELISRMQALPRMIASFPSRLGQAGQPGYLVLALSRQQLIVPTLLTLLPSQRVALARDWEAGKQYLAEQYRLLRSQSRNLRRRSTWSHATRLTRSVLNNHPGLALFCMSLLALNLAFPRLRQEWLRQIAVVSCLILLRVVFWWAGSRHTAIPLPEPSVSAKRKRRSKSDHLSGRPANR